MVGVLTELEARYGTVRAYARAGGVAQRDLDRLADRLRA
jgi:hypothetical protein